MCLDVLVVVFFLVFFFFFVDVVVVVVVDDAASPPPPPRFHENVEIARLANDTDLAVVVALLPFESESRSCDARYAPNRGCGFTRDYFVPRSSVRVLAATAGTEILGWAGKDT